MIKLFLGSNALASYNACMREAKDLAGKDGEIFSFDADEFDDSEVAGILSNTTLFGGKRVIIFKRACSKHEDTIINFAHLLGEDHLLLWESDEIDKRKHKDLFKYIKKNGEILEFEKEILANNETQQRNMIYAFSDAWVEGSRERAIKLFYGLLRETISSQEVFWALHWQIRSMLRISILARNLGEKEIIQKTKLHPYVVSKNLKALQRRNHVSLHRSLLQLQNIDVKTKTASWETEDALLHFLLTT